MISICDVRVSLNNEVMRGEGDVVCVSSRPYAVYVFPERCIENNNIDSLTDTCVISKLYQLPTILIIYNSLHPRCFDKVLPFAYDVVLVRSKKK